ATSWAELARAIFELSGRAGDDVTAITSDEYAAGKRLAPRPLNSALDLSRLRGTGFEPIDAMTALADYVRVE
ncbi:MAG: NAD-dependent epimerase/dehydratase family protein, partial [Marmoricola sp.]|nr:NAD-dependent epimerase/dehydratase family protein [Marmoricola sp.]